MASLLYSIVFASRCTSNHHRLAVDALRHLQSAEAEDWRNLLLHYHDDYLKGAKAPDAVFKDFKNHVLHVREGEWGGAIEAAEEWYRRTVRALAAKDWKQAAWSAGVMSHYYVDPIQPFHTHQTEEEGVIHRAVEWSFSKSYKIFQDIIEAGGGYPDITVPAGADWLAQMVRAGAKASNPHYETVIDHYDFEKGAKKPLEGLDQELKNVIAGLVGHAAVGLARILDRAFEEAAVRPPRINGLLQAFFLTLEVPIQMVLAKIEDNAARAEVAAQYEEFRRTGKVRQTLGEDDKVVRALHAHEVLKTPISSLDARWPKETGTQAGAGAQPPAPAKKQGLPQLAALSKAAAPRPKQPEAEPPPVEAKAAPKPPAKPVEKPARDDKPPARFTLDGDAPVVDAPSIGPKTAKRLEAAGVRTVADLLAVTPATAAAAINVRHINAQVVHDWQAQALLACTVPGLKSREAQALVGCGVRDAGELVQFEPAMLAEAIGRWCASDEAERAWGAATPPSEDDVAEWIARAKSSGKAPPKRGVAA